MKGKSERGVKWSKARKDEKESREVEENEETNKTKRDKWDEKKVKTKGDRVMGVCVGVCADFPYIGHPQYLFSLKTPYKPISCVSGVYL